MDPNFERMCRKFDKMPGKCDLRALRRRYHRSANGKILGVFSGIAESRGWCIGKVRWIGIAILFFVATSVVEAHGIKAILLVCGFFYLLLALLMRSPDGLVDSASSSPVPPPIQPSGGGYPGSGGYPGGAVPHPGSAPAGGLRPDFAQIDRQLDGLNRRIQRMETIVTDRQYDWERRMGS